MVPELSSSIYQAPKCFVTYGTLGHVDPDQGPSGRKPWSVLRDLSSIHKVDLILPHEVAGPLQEQLQTLGSPSYSRVDMTLGQILERDFFTEYVKKGNIIMLSQGKKAIDDVFFLQAGTLTMYLGKESYEKAGLVGKPYGAKGSRKLKPRWVVWFDLKSSSMVHGKKGFDRLIYACQKVFDKPLSWLFSNIGADPLQQHSPVQINCQQIKVDDIDTAGVSMRIDPSIGADGNRSILEDKAGDLYEWLSLVRLGSPRVSACDGIDTYLSRYEPPEAANGQMKVCVLRWKGFISSTWLQQLAVAIITTLPQKTWFSLSATELSSSLSGASKEVVLLRPDQPRGEYLMWEIQGSE